MHRRHLTRAPGSDTRSSGASHALLGLGFMVAIADILVEEIVAVVAEAAIAAAVVEMVDTLRDVLKDLRLALAGASG